MNKTKQWFLYTFGICLAVLAICAIMTVTADPFFYYSWDEEGEEIFFNQRYQSAGIARNAEMDTLILGTSMVSNFRASYLEETFGVEITDEKLMAVATAACAENDTLHNMPFVVTAESVAAAIKAADAYGRYYLEG